MTYRNGKQVWTISRLVIASLAVFKSSTKLIAIVLGFIVSILIDIGGGTSGGGNFFSYSLDVGFMQVEPIQYAFALQIAFYSIQVMLFARIKQTGKPKTAEDWANIIFAGSVWIGDTLIDGTWVGIGSYNMPSGQFFPDNAPGIFWVFYILVLAISGLGEWFLSSLFLRDPDDLATELELPRWEFTLPSLPSFKRNSQKSVHGGESSVLPADGGNPGINPPSSSPFGQSLRPGVGTPHDPNSASSARPPFGQPATPFGGRPSLGSDPEADRVAADKREAQERLQETQRMVFGKFSVGNPDQVDDELEEDANP